MILDHFVFHHAHAGFGDRHLRQRNPRIVRGKRRCCENPVDLFLRVLRVPDLRGLDAGDQRIEHLAVLLLPKLCLLGIQHFFLLVSHDQFLPSSWKLHCRVLIS